MIKDQYISLSRGGRFYFDEMNVSDFTIGEIADALSKICRFTGHTRCFYSVAEHSVLTSMIVPRKYAFEALMHDAHEAFVGDVAAPLKALLADYQVIEERVAARVRKTFGLPITTSEPVKLADLQMLALEKKRLMIGATEKWECLQGIEPADVMIFGRPPCDAAYLFMQRFHTLNNERMS